MALRNSLEFGFNNSAVVEKSCRAEEGKKRSLPRMVKLEFVVVLGRLLESVLQPLFLYPYYSYTTQQ